MTAGTKEWAETNLNFQKGCRNNCVYCYAKSMAIRFGTATAESWKEPVIAIPEKYPAGKTVMMPSSHDIDSDNVNTAIFCLIRLLERDNHVLVVTKAEKKAIDKIIKAFQSPELEQYKQYVSFRVTIGSTDDRILRLFEPDAPSYSERVEALKALTLEGFKTSVSAEPLLGGLDEFNSLYQALKGHVTDCIWVGKMNMPRQRIRMNTDCKFDESLIDWILKCQSGDEMYRLYLKYKDNELVCFKDSVLEAVKLKTTGGC